eukprot:s2360_g7.t1
MSSKNRIHKLWVFQGLRSGSCQRGAFLEEKQSMQDLFSFCTEFQGRTFTHALCKLVVRKLVMAFGKDSIPRDPGVPFGKFLNKQSVKFKHLVQKAKKVKAGVPSGHVQSFVQFYYVYLTF